jgi:spore maturation protein CgeB
MKTMNILFTGYHNPLYRTVTEYIEDAISSLGHDLFSLNEGRHVIPGRIRQRVRVLEHLDLECFNSQVISCARKVKPDVAIFAGGERILPKTAERLKNMGIVTVLWTIDAPGNLHPILRSAPACDHIFCQGTEAIEILEGSGIRGAVWLPMACDPLHHHREELTDVQEALFGHDVVFVGSYYPVRERLFEALTGFDLAIWGSGWDRLPPESPLKSRIKGIHTPPAVWRKIYSAGKIVLAPHFQDPEGRYPVYQASPRIFEALACGAFVICDPQRDVLSLFQDGRHLVVARDANDLRDKVRYYLEHSGERKRIAMQGREEVILRHTYGDRLKGLFSLLDVKRQGVRARLEASVPRSENLSRREGVT